MPALKIFNIVKSTDTHKKQKQSKMIEARKNDLKNIFKTFQDISQKEISRTKSLLEEHRSLFDEPVKEAEVVVVENDEFFK